MKWLDNLPWEQGRQGSGYEKILLTKYFKPFVFQFDFYLLRFKPGSHIGWHVDPVSKGLQHYRANLFIRQAKRGGVFKLKGKALVDLPFLQIFRPDIQLHCVTEIEEGTRYVLSLGWVKQVPR